MNKPNNFPLHGLFPRSNFAAMIPRPKLEYHPDGHPVLSKKQIEDYAGLLVRQYFPSQLVTAQPLRPAQLITLVHEEDGVVTEPADLGSEGGRKRLGRMYLKKKIILLDQVLFAERQISLPFVMAHELAHWLLHRDCSITAIKDREQLPDDGEEAEEIDSSPFSWSAMDRLEWQASKLAGGLLMPKAAALTALVAVQQQMGIVLRQGVVYQNTTPEGRAESEEQIERVSNLFGVSKTVTRIRLADLGMYEQQEKEDRRVGSAHNPFSSIGINLGISNHA